MLFRMTDHSVTLRGLLFLVSFHSGDLHEHSTGHDPGFYEKSENTKLINLTEMCLSRMDSPQTYVSAHSGVFGKRVNFLGS